MLKKEFCDTLRILFVSSLLLLAFPVMFLMDRFLFHSSIKTIELAQAVYVFSGLIFVVYSGLALFRRERKDHGLEYLLTLPLSRMKILMYKMMPRVFFVVVIAVVYQIIFGNQELIMTDVFINRLFIAVLLLHLIAVCLSLVVSNLVIGFIGVYMMQLMWVLASEFSFNVFRRLIGYTFAVYSPWTWILPGLTLLLPLAISFLLSFRSLDLRPMKYHIKPYLAISFPLVLLQAVLILWLYEMFSS